MLVQPFCAEPGVVRSDFPFPEDISGFSCQVGGRLGGWTFLTAPAAAALQGGQTALLSFPLMGGGREVEGWEARKEGPTFPGLTFFLQVAAHLLKHFCKNSAESALQGVPFCG